MPGRRVRMIDVAEAAGVSRTTASLVLNGRHASIPIRTREKVISAARQMGYEPHATAVALRTGRCRRIGIVLNEPEDFDENDRYFSTVLAGVTKGALRHDYNLMLHSRHYLDWRQLYADIVSPAADGTLLIGRYAGDPLTGALVESGYPAVCISYQIDNPECWSVDCDNVQGGYLAMQHVLGLRHRSVAFFYPGEESPWGRDRLAGARNALAERGRDGAALHVFAWPPAVSLPSQEWIEAAIAFLLTRTPRPTALICCDEVRAQSITEQLPLAGLDVPHDMAVVSFNSTEQSARTRPPLTSVAQPLKEIGAAAVDMLVSLIEDRAAPDRCLRFPMRLDIRQSCGAARADIAPVAPACAVRARSAE